MIKSIPLRALPRILVTNFLLQVTIDQKKMGSCMENCQPDSLYIVHRTTCIK